MKEKWSSSVRLKKEGLHGWHEHDTPEKRHAAVERTIREDGYATAIRRLGFLRNVADRESNGELSRVAEEDERWARDWEHEERGDEDRVRPPSDLHEVRRYERKDGARIRRHLARNPRRRQWAVS